MNKIKKFVQNHLVLAIVAAIVVEDFLDPSLHYIARTILYIMRSFSTALYDRIFKEMAFGKPDYAFLLWGVVSVLFFLFIGYSIVNSYDKQIGRMRKLEIISQQITQSKRNNRAISIKTQRILFIIFFSFITLSQIIIVELGDVKFRAVESFEQKIRIITPYVDAHTKDLLISDFSRMESHDNFTKIISRIDTIASKNNIKLPKTNVHIF